MKLTVTFLHLEHTPSLDERIQEKSEKLWKYLNGATNLKWSCYVKDGLHWAEIKADGPQYHYHAKAKSDCLYKTIDAVVNKIERQINKHKDKWKDNKHKTGCHQIEIMDYDNAWLDYDDEAA